MKTELNKLEEIDKTKNPFRIPDNYFAQFNQEIMDRLPEKEIIVPKTIPMWDRVKPWAYLAALFAGLYFTVNFLKQAPQDKASDTNRASTEQMFTSASDKNADNYWSTAQITEDEFYQYLEEQLIDDSYFDYMDHQYDVN